MTAGLRERKRKSTANSIWVAAMEMFAERGYDNVSVEEIVASCELSPRTFFRYYRTKEDVLFAGADVRRRLFLEAVAAQPQHLSVFDTIREASLAMAEQYQGERQGLQTLIKIIEDAPSLKTRNAASPQRWEQDVIELCRSRSGARHLSNLQLRVVVTVSLNVFRAATDEFVAAGGNLRELIRAAFSMVAGSLESVGRPEPKDGFDAHP